MKAYEVNFDGLVGPTHNYGGLSFGNVASEANIHGVANPQEAAKQGLLKMKTLHDMGLRQGVLAPQERPALQALRRLGFGGSEQAVLATAAREAPRIFSACCSASGMWTANAATVAPSADTGDGKVHFTPANLCSKFHRSLEPETTGRLLQAIFADGGYFRHHPPLPGVEAFGDEGAANHTRLCTDYGNPGVQLFVYGKRAFNGGCPAPSRYPARQTLEASQAVGRLHRLDPERTVFAQQNPTVIDAGVFHNDVIAVGNGNVLFYHQQAFLDGSRVRAEIQRKFGDAPLHFIEVASERVSVAEVVASYLFNSQLVTLPDGDMALILPEECQTTPVVWDYLQVLVEGDNPIRRLKVLDLKQSMRNGGGPACLRLRVVLNEPELAAANPSVMLNDALFATLNAWVDGHYRDRLSVADLSDPALLNESRTALDELTRILNLGSVYPFQMS